MEQIKFANKLINSCLQRFILCIRESMNRFHCYTRDSAKKGRMIYVKFNLIETFFPWKQKRRAIDLKPPEFISFLLVMEDLL